MVKLVLDYLGGIAAVGLEAGLEVRGLILQLYFIEAAGLPHAGKGETALLRFVGRGRFYNDGVEHKLDLIAVIEDDDTAEEKDRKIVKRKTFPVRPMSVEDAMIEMELLGHNFFAFVNIDTEQTNVLYLRKDGDLGLLEPEV